MQTRSAFYRLVRQIDVQVLSFDHHRVKQVKMRLQVVMTKLGTTLLVFTFDRIQSLPTDLSDLYTVTKCQWKVFLTR